MNKRKVANELIKIAKELTGAFEPDYVYVANRHLNDISESFKEAKAIIKQMQRIYAKTGPLSELPDNEMEKMRKILRKKVSNVLKVMNSMKGETIAMRWDLQEATAVQ